jgi:chemotaxis protein methyltransferase CheR
MTTLSRKAFESVTQLFHDVSGIRLGDNKHALVSGRLQRLAQEAGESDLDAYVARLTGGTAPAAEMTRVIDRLTTNETYFFREPQHFNDLAERLREHASQSAGGKSEFTVWSAASSSGEEAFSVAMLMADLLGNTPWQVVGTDLSTSVVEAARRGLYPMERARMVPADYLKRFCLKGQGEHEGQLLVSKALRERVRFLTANLMQTLPQLPQFDVIFLRNVLIYFDNDAKAQIVRRVLTQLKPQGVLYTGHAESLSTLNLPVKALATAIHVHG